MRRANAIIATDCDKLKAGGNVEEEIYPLNGPNGPLVKMVVADGEAKKYIWWEIREDVYYFGRRSV